MQGMLLAREFVDYVSRQIVKKLTPQWIETTDDQVAAEFIANVIEEDLAIEDSLNDEVREMLSQYSDYMRREGVSYQDMFRRIKNTLITQRKVIRASGRDSGDSMKLSRDKINDISHKIVGGPAQEPRFPAEARSQRRSPGTGQGDDGPPADRGKGRPAARTKIRTQKREIAEGTEEWELLHKRYYAEELKKLGIDLTH